MDVPTISDPRFSIVTPGAAASAASVEIGSTLLNIPNVPSPLATVELPSFVQESSEPEPTGLKLS
jgi:hypothetical protein